MKKIVYKDSDYKFGKPVGYINIPETGEIPDDLYLYKDSNLTEKYTSEEIKNFYLNSGIVAIIVTIQGDNVFGGYCSLGACIRQNNEGKYLYYCTATIGDKNFTIEAEESQG